MICPIFQPHLANCLEKNSKYEYNQVLCRSYKIMDPSCDGLACFWDHVAHPSSPMCWLRLVNAAGTALTSGQVAIERSLRCSNSSLLLKIDIVLSSS